MKLIIKEFAGTVTLQVNQNGEILKLPKETIENMLEYMHSQGLLYSEKVGKDRLQTILVDK